MRFVTLAAAAALAALAAAPALAQDGALPEVEAPDFAEAGAVRESIETMIAAMDEVKDAEGWKALRAIDECETVDGMIEDQWSAGAYDAEGGEDLWRLCHGRYEGLKLH
jgi:hypothetical protein